MKKSTFILALLLPASSFANSQFIEEEVKCSIAKTTDLERLAITTACFLQYSNAPKYAFSIFKDKQQANNCLKSNDFSFSEKDKWNKIREYQLKAQYHPAWCMREYYSSGFMANVREFEKFGWVLLGNSDDGLAKIYYASPTKLVPQEPNTAWFQVVLSERNPEIYNVEKWKANCQTGQIIKLTWASFYNGELLSSSQELNKNEKLMFNHICNK